MTTIERSVNQATSLIYLFAGFTPNPRQGASARLREGAVAAGWGLSEPWRKMSANSFAPFSDGESRPPARCHSALLAAARYHKRLRLAHRKLYFYSVLFSKKIVDSAHNTIAL